MQKAGGRAQLKQKQQKQRKQQKKVVNKAPKRTKTTQIVKSQQSLTTFAPKVQQRSFSTFPQRQLTPSTPSFSKFPAFATPFAPSKQTSLFKQQKRQMSMGTHTRIKSLVPCDPRFEDDEVISMLNHKTGLMEPIIVAVPEPSFEWIFSSPVDLHTFDVIPVVKDCIDPENPTFESMDA